MNAPTKSTIDYQSTTTPPRVPPVWVVVLLSMPFPGLGSVILRGWKGIGTSLALNGLLLAMPIGLIVPAFRQVVVLIVMLGTMPFLLGIITISAQRAWRDHRKVLSEYSIPSADRQGSRWLAAVLVGILCVIVGWGSLLLFSALALGGFSYAK